MSDVDNAADDTTSAHDKPKDTDGGDESCVFMGKQLGEKEDTNTFGNVARKVKKYYGVFGFNRPRGF
jgi:hypothetical protein